MAQPSILILTHGSLAEALLASARTIVGRTPDVRALSLAWDDSPEEAARRLGAEVAGMDTSAGLLVLTDIYGGTPFNVASSLASVEHMEVVSGVNVPMVVRLCCGTAAGRDVHELADWIVEKTRSGISRSRTATVEDRPCDEASGDSPAGDGRGLP